MAEEATRALALLAAAWASSAIASVLLARLAPRMGLVDVPGGRKAHARAVPLVGGSAVFAALLVAAWVSGAAHAASWFLLSLAIVIMVGLWDDVTDLPARLKLAIQVIASGIMIWGAG